MPPFQWWMVHFSWMSCFLPFFCTLLHTSHLSVLENIWGEKKQGVYMSPITNSDRLTLGMFSEGAYLWEAGCPGLCSSLRTHVVLSKHMGWKKGVSADTLCKGKTMAGKLQGSSKEERNPGEGKHTVCTCAGTRHSAIGVAANELQVWGLNRFYVGIGQFDYINIATFCHSSCKLDIMKCNSI